MAIDNKLQTIIDIKEDIGDAINNKGGTITSSTPFAQYATQIDNLQIGGGGGNGLEINELLQQYTVASGASISPGTFVDFIEGQNVQLLDDVNVFRENIGSNDPSPFHFYKAVVLDKDRILVIYRDFTNNIYSTARIIRFTGNGISLSNPVVFNQGNGLQWDLAIVGNRIDEFAPHKAMVVYRDADNNGFITTNILEVFSDDNISVGPKVVLRAKSGLSIAIAALPDQRIVVAYTELQFFQPEMFVATLKGNTFFADGSTPNIGSGFGNKLSFIDLNQFNEARLWHSTTAGNINLLIVQGINIFPMQFGSYSADNPGDSLLFKISNQRAVVVYTEAQQLKARTLDITSFQSFNISSSTTLINSEVGIIRAQILSTSDDNGGTAKILLAYADPTTGTRYDAAMVSLDGKKIALLSSYFDTTTIKTAAVLNVGGVNSAITPSRSLRTGLEFQSKGIIEYLQIERLVTPTAALQPGNQNIPSLNQIFGIANTGGNPGDTIQVWVDQHAEPLKPIGGVVSLPAKTLIRKGEFVSFINDIGISNYANFAQASVQKVNVAALDGNRAVVVYRDLDNEGYGTAVVVQRNNEAMFPGTPVVFKAAAVSTTNDVSLMNKIAITRLDDTRVLVAYTVAGDAEAVVITSQVNTNTMTIGTPVSIENNVSHLSIDALDGGKVFCAYSRTSGSNNKFRARILSISGDTITVNNHTVIDDNEVNYISVSRIDNNAAGIA